MPNFPLSIAFRIFTLHPQMTVKESSGAVIGYVRQNLWRFKEAVTVFTDETQAKPIYQINADRVIDFNANYAITNASGQTLGTIRRDGMRSLWRASYTIDGIDGRPGFHVHERSAFVRLIDNLIGEIPLVGLLSGYFFNPIYDVTRADGNAVLTMLKQRSLLEANFTITQLGALDDAERERLLLGLMMIILLERSRG
jgi:hypothetical protein